MGRTVLAVLALLALPASAQAAAVRLDVDPGEGRTPASSVLVYTAAAGEANRLTVALDDSTFTLDDAVPITPGAHCSRPVPADPTRVRCTGAEDGDAEVTLGDGDDEARARAGDVFATVDAGPGDDRVHAQSVSGGAGQDRIYGSVLAGGPGDDIEVADDTQGFGATFDEGSAADGTDLLVGSDAEDTVSYERRTGPVRISLDGRADDGAAGERDDLRSIEDVTGGTGADVLSGDDGPNHLDGGPGHDTLRGGGGPDRLWADFFGDDRKGPGDVVSGGPGDDFVAGSNGPDLLVPGAGADEVRANGGNDRIRARDAAIDDVSCGTGNDRVTLNRLDFVNRDPDPFYGRCEHLFRRGVPAPVPVRLDASSQSDELVAEVGCPADMKARCTGRVRVFVGKKSRVGRFSAKPGARDFVSLGPSAGLNEGRRLRIATRGRGRNGRVRVVTRTLPIVVEG